MAKDICISCGKETPYEFETHIDDRTGYMEGMGQFCLECYKSELKIDSFCVPKELITETPNDMELGKKIRTLYNRLK
jgi:hypothetical protein